jgi:hypothetical protein
LVASRQQSTVKKMGDSRNLCGFLVVVGKNKVEEEGSDRLGHCSGDVSFIHPT